MGSLVLQMRRLIKISDELVATLKLPRAPSPENDATKNPHPTRGLSTSKYVYYSSVHKERTAQNVK
jgi:hypothetical protein